MFKNWFKKNHTTKPSPKPKPKSKPTTQKLDYPTMVAFCGITLNRHHQADLVKQAVLDGINSPAGRRIASMVSQMSDFKNFPTHNRKQLLHNVMMDIVSFGLIDRLLKRHPKINSIMVTKDGLNYYINGKEYIYGNQKGEDAKLINQSFIIRLASKLAVRSSLDAKHIYYKGLHKGWIVTMALTYDKTVIITMNKPAPVPTKGATRITTQPIKPKITNYIYEKLQTKYPKLMHQCYVFQSGQSKHVADLKVEDLLLNSDDFSHELTHHNQVVTSHIMFNLFHLGVVGRLLMIHPKINRILFDGKNLDYAWGQKYLLYYKNSQSNRALFTIDDAKMITRTVTYDAQLDDRTPFYCGLFGSGWNITVNRIGNDGNVMLMMNK